MSGFYFLFAFLAIPIFFLLMVWVTVTAYRILVPEKTREADADPVAVRQKAAAEGRSVPVGAREIREDQRAARTPYARAPYHYALGDSDGLPEAWREDLWRRCN